MKAERLPRLIEEACVLAFVDEQARGLSHRLELDPAAQLFMPIAFRSIRC